MAKPSIQYKRLPGRGWRREGNWVVSVRRAMCRLWLGPDHLLSAERSWYVEEYKRFYYRDIQAVIMRRTRGYFIANTILTALFICFSVFALVGGPVGSWIFGIMAAVLLLFLLINIFQGPTCRTHLKTAVQVEEMPSWRRIWRTEKGLARLRERVLEAQGSIAPEEAKARLSELINPQAPVNPAAAEPSAQSLPPESS
jgi:uncharacterized membrane protein